MEFVASLVGHSDEVTQVKWNKFIEKWVTASDDGTIRTWVCCCMSDIPLSLCIICTKTHTHTHTHTHVHMYTLFATCADMQAPDGGDDCEQFVRVGQPVSLLAIDKIYGFILAAVNNVIR